jgi:hypothetical protein
MFWWTKGVSVFFADIIEEEPDRPPNRASLETSS